MGPLNVVFCPHLVKKSGKTSCSDFYKLYFLEQTRSLPMPKMNSDSV